MVRIKGTRVLYFDRYMDRQTKSISPHHYEWRKDMLQKVPSAIDLFNLQQSRVAGLTERNRRVLNQVSHRMVAKVHYACPLQ